MPQRDYLRSQSLPMRAFAIILILLFSATLKAQEKPNSALYLTIRQQDSLLFERGYNQCDMSYLESVTHKDLSAYYSNGEAQSREKFFEDILKYHCTDAAKKPIRKTDPNTLEVYTLSKKGVVNGAVISGSQNFYLREAGKPDISNGVSKFTHLWLLENGKWLLKEAMSFDRRENKE